MIAAPQQLQNGGLKLPPFPPRDYVQGNPNPPPPKVDLSEKEADELKSSIYAQLDEFDGQVPHFVRLDCLLTSQQDTLHDTTRLRVVCQSATTLQIHRQVLEGSREVPTRHLCLGHVSSTI